ncbi:hypothetical protein FNV43_RR23507 [Rhamnella rubrinervis]|uniref:C2 domain-containing protein n=1 Tax=Rhamnella rubrinervis TaxID=2594499 RepID=A0A8K0DSF0_9ROSA|nr:hypothetical protein FNV43_RR23507 [Rhamnella rubrinervis]
MEYRALEVTIISARGLKKVKHLTKMDVYVIVSLPGGPHTEQKTPVDKDGGTSPNWNFPMKFIIDEADARKNRNALNFKVKCSRRLHSDEEIGEVNVPLEELLDNGGDGKFVKYVTYQVRKISGKLTGELNLSYKFADDRVLGTPSSSFSKADEPAMGYPADINGAMSSTHHRPPPPPCTHACTSLGTALDGRPYRPPGYPVMEIPPPAGFAGGSPPMGYPVCGVAAEYVPQVMGYGYAPLVRPQEADVNKLDPALLSAILGGLLIGEMVNDQAANNTNAANQDPINDHLV